MKLLLRPFRFASQPSSELNYFCPIMIKHARKWTDTGEVLRSSDFTDLLRKFHVSGKRDSVAVRAHKYFIRNGCFYERIFVHVTTVSFVAGMLGDRVRKSFERQRSVNDSRRPRKSQQIATFSGKFFGARFSNYNPKRTERCTSACIVRTPVGLGGVLCGHKSL